MSETRAIASTSADQRRVSTVAAVRPTVGPGSGEVRAAAAVSLADCRLYGYRELADCLRAARQACGLSQARLGELAGHPRQAMLTRTVEDAAAAMDVTLRFDGARWDWEVPE